MKQKRQSLIRSPLNASSGKSENIQNELARLDQKHIDVKLFQAVLRTTAPSTSTLHTIASIWDYLTHRAVDVNALSSEYEGREIGEAFNHLCKDRGLKHGARVKLVNAGDRKAVVGILRSMKEYDGD